MKLAISGKGGVGKTTLASFLIRALNDQNKKILAIDADPDANLGTALGMSDSEKMLPISEMKKLVFERTGVSPGTIGGFFNINPKVDDIPDDFSMIKDNIKLMRLGSVKKGGGGCLCPESAFLRALVSHVMLNRNEFVIIDMEAGIEHLGRATAQAVDKLLIVVEPGYRSIETAKRIRKLALELRLDKIAIIGNKVRNQNDRIFLETNLSDFFILGFIPYDESLIKADLSGISPYDSGSELRFIFDEIIIKLGIR